MADTKTPDGKTLSVGGKSTLSLKPRTETGTVRQSFSHGRSKQVVVEVKKRRVAATASPRPPRRPGRRAGSGRQARGPAAPAAKPAAKPAAASPARRAAPAARRRSHPASCCAP